MDKRIDAAFAILADPVRRRVVERLCAGPCCAGDLAAACRVTAPAMSRHLRRLRQAGFVEGSTDAADARVRLYRLRKTPLADLRRWLEALESTWGDQLQAFKAHAEAKASGGRR